ncbi:MAG TPA: hypothetical protein VHS76_05780, partial [Steroidobacteraceae bacterium]|nr:hypothetical protein [Steroidobacteraceae bacterium]
MKPRAWMALLLAQLAALSLIAPWPAPQAQAAESCQLGRVAELPITMSGFRPIITAKINGQDARFVLDSGAFYSMISAAT